MIVFRLLVRPTLYALAGCTQMPQPKTVQARLTQNIPSVTGREDHAQVRLSCTHGVLHAEPVFGKSNLIYTLIRPMAWSWCRWIREDCTPVPRSRCSCMISRGLVISPEPRQSFPWRGYRRNLAVLPTISYGGALWYSRRPCLSPGSSGWTVSPGPHRPRGAVGVPRCLPIGACCKPWSA